MQLVNDDLSLMQQDQQVISKTISRSLKTAKLFDVFWERWLVHGVDIEDLSAVRSNLNRIESWFESWEELAIKKVMMAQSFENEKKMNLAEQTYRQASLYYNLNYWLNPQMSEQKKHWYKKCLQFIKNADSISNIETRYVTIYAENQPCAGRIRVPKSPKGCILIINPIDSSKEELYKYEVEFAEASFITLSFDGPGQGETFLLNSVIGTRTRWEAFVNQLIEYTYNTFRDYPIHLFGTSLGGSWALYGSAHEKVDKTVVVSPAFELDQMNMPSYFMDRLSCSCIIDDKEKQAIPKYYEINHKSPIVVFHGNLDRMVPDEVMYRLCHTIKSEKQLIEYIDESHVCNNKLEEIRNLTLLWFSGKLDLKKGV